jgi:hypothetical protein
VCGSNDNKDTEMDELVVLRYSLTGQSSRRMLLLNSFLVRLINMRVCPACQGDCDLSCFKLISNKKSFVSPFHRRCIPLIWHLSQLSMVEIE